MTIFTPQRPADVASIADRTGFTVDAIESMSRSIVRGGGGMAQFDHPAFGGPGQWMRGGMLMISDPSDHALKLRIAQLCELLAGRAEVHGDVAPLRGSRAQDRGTIDVEGSPTWYPAALGVPSSSGAQNRTRYAWFAATRRLAVDDGEGLTIYDTADHVIGGVSQQQGVQGTVAFTSQHGIVDIARLRVVEGAAHPDTPPTPAMDPFAALERLAALHARGIVSDDEFAAKRIELLERI